MHGINKTNIKMVDLKLNQSLTTLNLITSNFIYTTLLNHFCQGQLKLHTVK